VYAAVRLTLAGAVDEDLLGRSLSVLERRHPMLRMRVRAATPGPVQVIAVPPPAPRPRWFEVRDLDGPVEVAEDEICNRVIRLETEPPLRAVLLRESRDRASLLLVVHHAAADGASLAILCEELWQVYTALSQGRPPALAPLAAHFRDVVRHTEEARSSPRFAADCDYWRTRLGSGTADPGGPGATAPGADPADAPPGRLAARQFRTDVATTRALQRTAAELDVSCSTSCSPPSSGSCPAGTAGGR
jgi:hypothetical protein